MKWGNLINLFTLYESSIEYNIERVILFYPKSTFLLLNATANDMAAKIEKSKVLHSFKACFNVLTTKNKPVANIIDGNVQLHVLSHKPDNFQGVTEMVSDYLPRPPRVNIVTKENVSSSLGAARYF